MGTATSSLSVNGCVPLLVLRVPEFEHVAWREGKRAARRVERRAELAFRLAASRVLRRGDRRIHERGRDVFAVIVAAPPRGAVPPNAAGCRAMLERIASEVSSETGLRIESGWTFAREPFDLDGEIEIALERGARERERYEFFATIGHELRTPLASIRGYIETLIDGGVDPPTSRRFLQTAQREALRMGRMIDGMLEFSLLDLSGTFGVATCNVAVPLALACDAVAPLAAARSIRIDVQPPPPVWVALDADACTQLLINLLENATKYGRDGGRIAVALERAPGSVRIVVDDDGPGISGDDRPIVFTMRARGAESSHCRGAGIGLAIVKLIAERCGGGVRAGDSPLGGARFEVVLPAQAEFSTAVS
jgi:signal transduction histidine kinase